MYLGGSSSSQYIIIAFIYFVSSDFPAVSTIPDHHIDPEFQRSLIRSINLDTNKLQALFFVYPKAIKLWKNHLDITLLDSTYIFIINLTPFKPKAIRVSYKRSKTTLRIGQIDFGYHYLIST
jgi:hypothetical protein